MSKCHACKQNVMSESFDLMWMCCHLLIGFRSRIKMCCHLLVMTGFDKWSTS